MSFPAGIVRRSIREGSVHEGILRYTPHFIPNRNSMAATLRRAGVGALIFLLSFATSAVAQPACQPPSPLQVYIVWFGQSSGCTPSNNHCRAGEVIAFSPVAFAYSFAACV